MGLKFELKGSFSFEEHLLRINHIVQERFRQKLFDLGKVAVDIAIRDGNYHDRTGVLRSSIGCGVFRGSQLLNEYGFFTTEGDVPLLEGKDGASLGRELMAQASLQNIKDNQLRLIVVAGASYAKYVEDKAPYQVLTSSKNFVSLNLPIILRQLNLSLD